MERLMARCNNYFERTAERGEYTISDNAIQKTRGKYAAGQYIRIMDSLLNDGVYKIKTVAESGTLILDGELVDEVFTGYVVGLAVPPAFVALSEKISQYDAKAGKHAGLSSESIPNYSVSYDTANKDGAAYYASEVAQFKKPIVSKFYFLTRVRIYD